MQQEPQGFLETALSWVGTASGWVWGPPLLVLLVGTGLYLTILLRGLQFRELGHSLWLALVKRREEGAAGMTAPRPAAAGARRHRGESVFPRCRGGSATPAQRA